MTNEVSEAQMLDSETAAKRGVENRVVNVTKCSAIQTFAGLVSLAAIEHLQPWGLGGQQRSEWKVEFIARIAFELRDHVSDFDSKIFKNSRHMTGLSTFEKIIHPYSVDFFRDYFFEKKPLLISRHNPDYFSELPNGRDIDAYLNRKDLIHPAIRFSKTHGVVDTSLYTVPFTVSEGIQYFVVDNVKAHALFTEGHSITFNGLHLSFPAISQYLADLEARFLFPFSSRVFSTPPHCFGLPSHYDGGDVIAIQLDGSKIWRFYDEPDLYPLEGCLVPVDGKTPKFEFEVKRGDTLYFPRGWVHQAHTLDEVSTHLGFGFKTPKWVDIINELISKNLDIDDLRRSFIPDEMNTEDVKKYIQSLFHQILESL